MKPILIYPRQPIRGKRTYYALHDLLLEVEEETEGDGKDLTRLLCDLTCVQAGPRAHNPSLRITVANDVNLRRIPRGCREVLQADGFSGLERAGEFYLTDGSSLFRLRPLLSRGDAQIAPSFFDKPPILQRNFWVFGLMKLLRPLGLYSLHAAGVAASKELGVLIVGDSGSGKSTLALDLIRQGWSYLGDDAVLLRMQPEGVEALAFRRNFYIDASAGPDNLDFPLGAHVPDSFGRSRRMVHVEEARPEQYIAACIPRVLLFSKIIAGSQSTLAPLDRSIALKRLLAASGPQLFDRNTMAEHLELLSVLLRQTVSYQLTAGRDLYRNPVKLANLLGASFHSYGDFAPPRGMAGVALPPRGKRTPPRKPALSSIVMKED